MVVLQTCNPRTSQKPTKPDSTGRGLQHML
uniref:Uncharacterized protein n=1 Tax=Arundo donax TaxID=35708 RepID=A0A0A9BQX4_ARUDO